jgi:hypothetical protein
LQRKVQLVARSVFIAIILGEKSLIYLWKKNLVLLYWYHLHMLIMFGKPNATLIFFYSLCSKISCSSFSRYRCITKNMFRYNHT